MGSEFRFTTLESLVSDVRNAIVGGPFGSNLVSKDYVESGIPVIRGKNMGFGRNVGGEFVFVSNEKAEALKANIARPNDLVFTQRGTLGQVAIVPETPWDSYIVSQSQMKATIDPLKADLNYLYYYFSSPQQVDYLISNSIQTGVPHTNLGQLKSHPVSIPSLNTQKTIAHILGSLDDKIELNRQMNETLESMAQALFKSWFVDFDPVIDNALAAGNLIPDVFAERAEQRREMIANAKKASKAVVPFKGSENDHHALFPREFEFTEEMGWIPKGWGISEIGELCEKIQNGGTPRRIITEFWENGTIPWLGSGEVRQTIITGAENKITDLGLSKSSAKWLPKGTTVIAMYGATAGQVAFLANKLTTNQAVCGLIPKEGFQYFNYLSLERAVSHFEGRATGSAQQNISKGIIEETKVIVPSGDIVAVIENTCEGIFTKWIDDLETIKTLSKLRDTLLPKLLSGELRIPDAENLIDEANA